VSTTDVDLEPPVEAIEEHGIHVRSFEADFAEGDGRTIEGRIVPYETPAQVADDPRGPVYREQFARGAFLAQLRAPNRVRVLLNFEHDQSLRGIVGHAVGLEDRFDGLHGTFRALQDGDGDKALALVNEGLLRGLSLEFAALRSAIVDGVVTRTRVRLDKVSLCRYPAYAGAEVYAVREDANRNNANDDDDDGDEGDGDEGDGNGGGNAYRVDPIDPELLSRLEALGVDTQLRAFVDRPWDGSPSRWPDAAAYCRSSLIDDNPAGEPKTIARCHLPIREPGSGDINVNAVSAALGRLNQVQTSPAKRAQARATLERLRAQIQARS
jgi:HK97 family phage prohead protease